jgi:hypothetical protein
MKAQLQDLGNGEQSVLFDCPGCGFLHAVRVDGKSRPNWAWNRSLEAPTFQPSVLVSWEMHGKPRICHSFVTDGRIQFLGDCTHALANQTIDLPNIED